MSKIHRTRLLLETWQREPEKNSVIGKRYEERKNLLQTVTKVLIPQRASWLDGRIDQFVPSMCRKYTKKQKKTIQRINHAKNERLTRKQRSMQKHSSRQTRRDYAMNVMQEVINQ